MKRAIRLILNTIPRPWLIRLSYVFIRFSALFYRGNKFECPVCGGRYRKFLPYGYVNIRENALCPGCLSLERHRWMWLYLNKRTDFFSAKLKVLHIAPEQSFLKRFKKLANLTYHTADLESPIADFKCDVQNMPFANGEYDVVFCNHVLEHIPDEQKALQEIYRVIKPGGFAILMVPADFNRKETFEDSSITDKKERTRIFGQYDHVRVYGLDYPKRLRKAGFVIDEPDFVSEIPDSDKNKFGLTRQEFIFSCRKIK